MRPAKPPKCEYKSTDPKLLPDRQVAKHRAKKNTKRWCKGKVGREHKWNYEFTNKWLYNPDHRIWRCSVCKKEAWMRNWRERKQKQL